MYKYNEHNEQTEERDNRATNLQPHELKPRFEWRVLFKVLFGLALAAAWLCVVKLLGI